MVFKIISGNRRKRGATLVEMMVASALGLMVLVGLTSFSLFSGHSLAALSNYAELERQSRSALDLMSMEIRKVRGLLEFDPHRLTFLDDDGGVLEYVYNPLARTLRRWKDGESRLLLDECDELAFEIFQRNPVGGTYDVYPTANPATCKLVQVTWTCSRGIGGGRINTEFVQSAKIVIRKKNL
jgi:hypothetical protein